MIVCLAGTGCMSGKKETLLQGKYFLESFYSIYPWQLEIFQQSKMWMLDSGAFSFLQGKNVNFDDYVEKYAKFINENDVKYFFELDIESIVGWDEYKRLALKLKKATKRNPIPVFHKTRGKEWFLNELDYCDYIAYGGIALNRSAMSEVEFDVMPWFISEAHKKGCKIHGLGFTATNRLKKIRFDSVDSTSWTAGGRFGKIHYLGSDGLMHGVDGTKGGKRATSAINVSEYNYLQWVKFQKYAEAHL